MPVVISKAWQGNFRVKTLIVCIATPFDLLYSLNIDTLLCIVEKNLWLSSWKEC